MKTPIAKILTAILLSVSVSFLILSQTGCVTGPDGKSRIQLFQTETNSTGIVTVHPSQAVLDTIAGVEGVNILANPTPSAPLINIGLAGLTALAGAIATWKTKRLNKETGLNSELDSALAAIVKAVELGPLSPQLKESLFAIIAEGGVIGENAESIKKKIESIDWSKGLKEAIQKESIKADVAHVVHKAVKSNTKL